MLIDSFCAVEEYLDMKDTRDKMMELSRRKQLYICSSGEFGGVAPAIISQFANFRIGTNQQAKNIQNPSFFSIYHL